MKRTETQIQGCAVIEPDVFQDHRGVFFESYNQEKFQALGISDVFVQDNHSTSVSGVLRGVHFQYPPKPMAKLVRCSRGVVFDVVVDMRENSASFKQWIGVELSQENRQMVYVPVGCAHGFYALTECEVLYKCAAIFDSTLDGGFAWNDPEIGIAWPLAGQPILSDRDRQLPSFSDVIGNRRL